MAVPSGCESPDLPDFTQEQVSLLVPENLAELASGSASLPLDLQVRFSPNSVLREDLCDFNNFFTIFSTGLLQLAHPVIGDAVDSQSRFFGNMWQRLDSSARGIAAIFLSDDATAAGHRIRDYHKYVWGNDEDGRRVHALDPEAYGWGWSTIMRMVEEKKRRFDRPEPTPGEWEAWYQEGRVAYRCQGVTAKYLPSTYESYREYFAEKCETRLRRTPAIDRALGQLDRGELDRPPQIPPFVWNRFAQGAVAKYIRILSVGGLPPEVRENLDIPWGKTDQIALGGIDWAVRNVWKPVAPRHLGYHPSLARAVLPPTRLHQRMLCGVGEFLAELNFPERSASESTAVTKSSSCQARTPEELTV